MVLLTVLTLELPPFPLEDCSAKHDEGGGQDAERN
jgi:hypothetical protein